MQTPPPVLNAPPRSWGQRNWRWFVPLLCLIAVGGVGGFVALLFRFMKSSDVYVGAVARARSAPAVVQSIGTPIREGFFFSGRIQVNGPSGRAELAIPIAGPKGEATIYVEATKSLGVWHYDRAVVELGGSKERIDISEGKRKPNLD